MPSPLNQALNTNVLRGLFPRSKLWGCFKAFASRAPIEVDAISGACMLLHSSVFKKVGGFSPEFFMYGEDYDLCAKVHSLGLDIVYDPDAEIVHHGGQSSGQQVKKFSIVWMRAADHAVIRKWSGGFAAWRYRMLQCMSATIRIALLGLAWLGCGKEARTKVRGSMVKWLAVLSWSLGLERWAVVNHVGAPAFGLASARGEAAASKRNISIS